jgi:hypothetical protein
MNYSDDEPTLREQLAIEQQQLQVDMAESTAKLERIRREEAAAAYLSREEQARADTVTKCYVPANTKRVSHLAPAPASLTTGWQNYIDTKVKSGDRHTLNLAMEVAGEAMAEMQKKLRAEFERKLETELMKVRIEFLQQQLDATRSVTRLKPVPDKGTLIA